MNIKDLPAGSYQPVATPKLNINSLPKGSVQPVSAPVAPAPTTRNAVSNIPVLGQLSNAGIGAGTAIAKTLTGIPEAISRGIGGALGGLAKIGPQNNAGQKGLSGLGNQFVHNADKIAQYKEDQFTKPYQSSLETVSGQAGNIAGNVAPYFLTGGAAALAKAPLLTRAAAAIPSVLADIAISQAQSGGDLATGGATAITSAIGNTIVPGGGGLVKRMLKGAVPGYTGDVAMGMAGQRGEDRKGASAFIPGLGTALGAGFAGAGYIKSPEYKAFKDTKTATKRTKTLTHLETNYPKVRTAFENATAKGVDAKHVLSNTDLLNGAVDNNGTVNVERAHQNFDKAVAPYEATVKQELKASGDKISLKNLIRARDSFMQNSNLEGDAYTAVKNKINANIKGLANRADKSGDVPLHRVHDAKVYSGQQRNYTDTGADNIGKEATRFLKTVVEDNASTIDIKTHNAGLSKMYAIRDVLEALGNKKVEGGRLQKHFSSLLGAYVGAHVGGPLGAIFGAESARAATGAHMSRAMGGNLSKTIQPHEGMVQSKNFGSRNRIQSNTSITTSPTGITPTVLPKAPKPKPVVPITEPSRLLAEPRKVTPLGGETIAGKVDASGSLIPHEGGKSGVKLVPAEKGMVGVDPKTKKFMRTYKSGFASKTAINTIGGATTGALAGVETDQNGKKTYNWKKGLGGAVAGGALGYGVSKGKLGLSMEDITKNLSKEDTKYMQDFIDSVNTGKPTKEVALNASRVAEGMKLNEVYGTDKALAKKFAEILDAKKANPARTVPIKVEKSQLHAEARKYKTAEEFVKAQEGELVSNFSGIGEKLPKVYNKKTEIPSEATKNIDWLETKSGGKQISGASSGSLSKFVEEHPYFRGGYKIADIDGKNYIFLKKGVDFNSLPLQAKWDISKGLNKEFVITNDGGVTWNSYSPITRSQLTDIWKQAHQ